MTVEKKLPGPKPRKRAEGQIGRLEKKIAQPAGLRHRLEQTTPGATTWCRIAR